MKKKYCSPTTEYIQLQPLSILCASGGVTTVGFSGKGTSSGFISPE